MLKVRVLKTAGILCLAVSVCVAGWLDSARADVPVPGVKPDIAAAGDGSTDILSQLYKSFAESLLDFGAAPIPKPRPFTMGKGVMAQTEIDRYKKIFDLQSKGKMGPADDEIAQLTDMRLRGYVLLQRYMHPTGYTSKYEELRNWLYLYADYPEAKRVYALAVKKKPANAEGVLPAPKRRREIARLQEPTMIAARSYKTQKVRTSEEERRAVTLESAVRGHIGADRLAQAYELLQKSPDKMLLDNVEYDILQGRIAAAYLHDGDVNHAYTLGSASAKRSGLHVPNAGWVAGLAAWQKGRYREAARLFEIPGRSPYASGWASAAGSYWAARAHMRAGNTRAVSDWLNRAADHPRTFYGLIATRALGRDFDFNWHIPKFTDQHRKVLSNFPAAQRAMALWEAGQGDWAQNELMRLQPGDQATRDALLSYANYARFPALAMRLGSLASASEGTYFDAALYPTGPWKPSGGYTMDPALIHAIMRQESRFDPNAESHSGAQGLMQVLPRTAKHVARSRSIQYQLLEPEVNLNVAQKYLVSLRKSRYVEDDLLYLLVAYNAGPGNLSKWKKRWDEVDDPLMFIELISSSETRAYVERVLSNYWIYRLRDGQDTPTLSALAEGRTAQYAENAMERAAYRVAQNR